MQIYGSRIQIGVAGSGKLRLAATGGYRIGAYEEDGSDFLAGMRDRKDTFMAGLALNVELPGGMALSTGYAHDVLGEIGGGEASIKIDKSFQMGVFRFSPQIDLNWISSELANHDFGVPSGRAKPDRPEYTLDSVVSLEGDLVMFIEITRDWLVALNTSIEALTEMSSTAPLLVKNISSRAWPSLRMCFKPSLLFPDICVIVCRQFKIQFLN